MSADARRRLTTGVLQAFLDHAPDQGFIVLVAPSVPDEFVQFTRSGGVVHGEVASRRWDVPESCDELAQSAPYLAELVDRLSAAASGSVTHDPPVVTSDVPEVRMTAQRLGGQVTPLGSPQRTLCP